MEGKRCLGGGFFIVAERPICLIWENEGEFGSGMEVYLLIRNESSWS